MTPREYIDLLHREFQKHGNAEDAEWMQKYMKDLFPYYGIKSTLRRNIQKEFFNNHGLPSIHDLQEVVLEAWEMENREFQYFALDLMDKFKKKVGRDYLDFYEKLIVSKSWWDTVDGIAPNLMGNHFKQYPEDIAEYTNRWMDSGNFWLQRACVLFQLKYKKDTDFELLKSYILPLTEEKEFFIRKAIGWALREYSKTNPEAVKDFITNTEMSGLSKREGLKWLTNKNML